MEHFSSQKDLEVSGSKILVTPQKIMYLLIPGRVIEKASEKKMQDPIKSEKFSPILMPHVIKVQNDKNTPYRQVKKQQLGKQSRKLQPWFTDLLELAQ